MFKSIHSRFFPSQIQKEFIRWEKDGGDFSNRFNYSLDSSSLVFDIGGFKGQFASDLYSRKPCKIYIFEPIKKYSLMIQERFKHNKDIRVFNFGLSNISQITNINLLGEASSIEVNSNFLKSDQEQVELVDLMQFVNFHKINQIDVMKINIEGSEYDLLTHIINNEFQSKVKYFQVQFHKLNNDSSTERDKIRFQLMKSHHCIFSYKFIWESWIRLDLL